MTIRITSKENGFRRAGIAHSSKATEYADDFFSKEQLEALIAEKMLVVEVLKKEKTQDQPESQNSSEEMEENGSKNQASEKSASEENDAKASEQNSKAKDKAKNKGKK